jgi:hypothetical protein
MGKLYNRAKMSVASAPGIGSVTLGTALAGFQSFSASGAVSGDLVSYVIEDGIDWEIGQGTLSGTPVSTLARTTVTQSSNSNQLITAGAGAIVYMAPLAADLQQAGLIVNSTAITGGTSKKIVYDNVGTFGEASVYYDNVNVRLGINSVSPGVTLEVSATDAVLLPVGNTSQRPTGSLGHIRYNTTLSSFEGYSSAGWGSIGGGATGGSTDHSFYLNDQTVTTDYTIPVGQNAGTFGPVTVNSTATITVSAGSTWTIV